MILFEILLLLILVILVSLVIYYFKNKNKNNINEENNNKIITKKAIKSYENKLGKKYYEVIYDERKTGIKWNSYKDALFYYEHIKVRPTLRYIYKSIQEDPYYILSLDKCTIYVVPENNKKYRYNSLFSDECLIDKYVYFLENNYNNKFNTLEKMYNNIIDSDYFEEKIILTNEEEKQIDIKIENALISNELTALNKLIKEYKDTVNLSNIIANKLIKINN